MNQLTPAVFGRFKFHKILQLVTRKKEKFSI